MNIEMGTWGWWGRQSRGGRINRLEVLVKLKKYQLGYEEEWVGQWRVRCITEESQVLIMTGVTKGIGVRQHGERRSWVEWKEMQGEARALLNIENTGILTRDCWGKQWLGGKRQSLWGLWRGPYVTSTGRSGGYCSFISEEWLTKRQKKKIEATVRSRGVPSWSSSRMRY